MRLRRLVLLAVATSSLAVSAAEGPWSETFTLSLAEGERTMAVRGGTPWLIVTPADAGNTALLLGRKDVVLETKCLKESQADGRQRVTLGSFPGWTAEGPAEVWATALDTDNLYLYGSLTWTEGGVPHLTVVAADPAPSDAQVIARRLAGVPANAWAERLKAAEWVRGRAAVQPNQEFWLAAADGIITQVIEDAAAQAATQADLALLDQAITWSVDLLHDVPRAGRLASVAWVRALTGPGHDQLARRLRRLGLDFYRDLWRPRSEALTLEFEDRYNAIGWKDADAFYRLGRWADVNGEYLPQAKDRTYRCYQAGYRADPNHQGIRNELGLPNTVSGDGTQAAVTADLLHHATGTFVPAPSGWKRGDRIEGDITWIDPTSETAYLSASVINTPENDALNVTWDSLTASVRARPGFQVVSEEDVPYSSGGARLLRYHASEGRYVRQAELLLVVNTTAHVGVRLEASYADEESEAVHRVLMIAFGRLVIPDAPPAEPAAAPAH